MAFLLYHVQNPKYRALVIRRNSEDLSDWVDRATQMYKRCGAVCTGKPAIFTFPSGAVVRTGHLKDANAFMKYQGHEYQNMLIEELTQITLEENYVKLIASCRSTVPGIPAQVFCTANPGNMGHEWVKERFRCDEKETWYKGFIDPDTQRSRVFIHATVDDNPELQKHDPEYIKWLDGLPETLRKQWRYGDWDDYDVDGAIFGSQMADLLARGRITSVPYDPVLPVETWWDLGYNDTNAIWFTQRVGREIRLIRYYEDNFRSLKEYMIGLHDLSRDLGYEYSCHNFPHDFGVHEYSDGKSREDKFKAMMMTLFDKRVRKGQDYRIIPRVANLQDAIDQSRDILPYCIFDDNICKVGIRALKNYRFEFDAKRNRYKDKPEHDEASHASSAFMQMAMGLNDLIKKPKRKKEVKRSFNALTGLPN
tara:strand:- start:1130 stop:2395 length:1266 start_codon:yes stop_codon:yes gene_type:complete